MRERKGKLGRSGVLLLLGVLLALGAAVSVLLMVGVPRAGKRPAGPGAGTLDDVEEPTESFANQLHGCSAGLRKGNMESAAACFAETLTATPFPAAWPEAVPVVKWFSRRTWKPESPVRQSRPEFIRSLAGFVARFDPVEDVRIKVKRSRATEGGARVEADLAFWLVGRNEKGRREWVQGKAKVRAAREPGSPWRMDPFEITEFGSMVASRDLFQEVSWEAGLEEEDPPVLEHPSLGLAAYGAAAADVDGDGLLDLFSTGARGNTLYLNQGDGTFRDAAAESWVRTLPAPGVAPLFVDYDNDGDSDLFITSTGGQFLFENRRIPEGRLVFRDVSLQAGVQRKAVGFSAAAGDVNGDGFPDLYVASYNLYGQVLPDSWDHATNGTANLLFVNQGDGTFREQGREWGIADGRWSYAASFADVDGDGDLDLYVANDFGGGNALFINQGNRFEDQAAARGVADGGYGMGVSFSDYDNDGDLDLHVTKMSSTAGRRILAHLDSHTLPGKERLGELASGNSLYANQGDGTFRDVSAEAGPFSAGWAWGGGFVDIDNDGREDLHTPNGFLSGASMKDT
ncbi:MAG: FG-GAP repeat domain-containing protein [Acidobacteriota bacterium]